MGGDGFHSHPSVFLTRIHFFLGHTELGTQPRVMKQVGVKLGFQCWELLPRGPPMGHLEGVRNGWNISSCKGECGTF